MDETTRLDPRAPSRDGERAAGALSLHGLAVAAGGRTLLSAVSFELHPRELVAFTGPSGRGKTTLLRAIAGLDDVAAGEVRLGGRSGAELGWPAFRRSVVYVAERATFLDATVLENLERPFAYKGASGVFEEPRALALLDAAGLGAAIGAQPARSLSAGEQRRVALVRALLVAPRFLLLDEPMNGLDALAAERVEGLLRRFTHAGGGVLFVSHDAALVARLCDRRISTNEFTREDVLDSLIIRRGGAS